MNELLELEPEFNVEEDKKYKVEAIKSSAIYAEVVKGQLPGLYYLVFWRGDLEDESIWKSISAILYLQKMISTFYKDYSEKPKAISPPLNSAPLMATLIVKLITKQKHGRLVLVAKQTKKT